MGTSPPTRASARSCGRRPYPAGSRAGRPPARAQGPGRRGRSRRGQSELISSPLFKADEVALLRKFSDTYRAELRKYSQYQKSSRPPFRWLSARASERIELRAEAAVGAFDGFGNPPVSKRAFQLFQRDWSKVRSPTTEMRSIEEKRLLYCWSETAGGTCRAPYDPSDAPDLGFRNRRFQSLPCRFQKVTELREDSAIPR